MIIDDKVIDGAGIQGVVHSESFYTYTSTRKTLTLHYKIDYGRGGIVSCSAEELTLYETPHLAQFMRVEISLRNDMYWGMKGTIVKLYRRSAKIIFDGYTKPVKVNRDDIEPLSTGSDIKCWLDSLLLVKEY